VKWSYIEDMTHFVTSRVCVDNEFNGGSGNCPYPLTIAIIILITKYTWL